LAETTDSHTPPTDYAPGFVRRRLYLVRLRKVAVRLAAILFGLLLAWLVLEVALRVAFEQMPPDIQGAIENVREVPWDERRIVPLPPFDHDIDYQRILKPGLDNYPLGVGAEKFHIDTISLWGARVGLRSDPPQWPVDIVVVGDSFAMCFVEFEDCWVERLHRDQGWNVMNLGQTSTGTRAHWLMLTTFGIRLEPRVVIWQWYGNDFNDDYGLGLLRGEYEPLDTPPQLEPEPDFGWLAKYSAVYAIIRDMIWQAGHDPQSWGQTVTIHGKKMRVGDDYNLYAFDLSRPSNAFGWDLSVQTLDDAARIVREEMNAELVIVLVPTKEEVYADYLVDVLGQDYLDNLSEGRLRMQALCDERGWRCIDATDTFQAAARAGEIIYHAKDLHINPRGNVILADLVGGYLTDEGLLSARK
jgi:hypothetical protein